MIGTAIAASAIPAALYLWRHSGAPPQPDWGPALVKTGALALLALGGLVAGAPAPITLGLALGAAGDLALARPGARAFLAGMAAFGPGHLACALAFWTGSPGPAWAVAAVLALAASTEVWLAPRLPGGMRAPVRAYVALIALMGVAALAGAGLFLLSDTLLAWVKFVARAPSRRLARAVWASYWTGQALILWGAVSGLSRDGKSD